MAILATERVLTLDYWKPAHKLQVGDWVFNHKGKPVQVTLIQEYRAPQCFEVELSDGLRISGDGKLSFLTENQKYRSRIFSYKGKFQFRRPLVKQSVLELADKDLKNKRNRLAFSIPTTNPIELPYQDLGIPPFVMGFWFFARNPSNLYSASSKNQDEVFEKLKDCGYQPKVKGGPACKRKTFTISPSIDAQLKPNIPSNIPNNYLLASVEQRIELLSGIILAKYGQYNEKYDRFQVSSKNYAQMLRLQGLVESLGCKTRLSQHKFWKHYTLTFKTKHKLVSYQHPKPVKVHHDRRYVIGITQIPAQSCVYVETSGEDNTILVGEGFISTC